MYKLKFEGIKKMIYTDKGSAECAQRGNHDMLQNLNNNNDNQIIDQNPLFQQYYAFNVENNDNRVSVEEGLLQIGNINNAAEVASNRHNIINNLRNIRQQVDNALALNIEDVALQVFRDHITDTLWSLEKIELLGVALFGTIALTTIGLGWYILRNSANFSIIRAGNGFIKLKIMTNIAYYPLERLRQHQNKLMLLVGMRGLKKFILGSRKWRRR